MPSRAMTAAAMTSGRFTRPLWPSSAGAVEVVAVELEEALHGGFLVVHALGGALAHLQAVLDCLGDGFAGTNALVLSCVSRFEEIRADIEPNIDKVHEPATLPLPVFMDPENIGRIVSAAGARA